MGPFAEVGRDKKKTREHPNRIELDRETRVLNRLDACVLSSIYRARVLLNLICFAARMRTRMKSAILLALCSC